MRAVNLIPAEAREGAGLGAGRSQGAAYGLLALVAGIALLAFLYGKAAHQISSRHSQAASLRAQAAREQAQASQLAPYASFIALREQRVQDVLSLVDSRFDWAHVMHEFGRVLPAGVSLSSLEGSVGGASGGSSSSSSASSSSASSSSAHGAGSSSAAAAQTVASATPPGSVPSFTLTGCATSQPMVALMLERLRLMDGAANVTLQSASRASSGGSCVGGVSFSAGVSFEPLPSETQTSSALASDVALKGSPGSAGGTGVEK